MAGSIRANWHLGDLETAVAGDPMAEIELLKSTGNPIDLSKGSAQLSEELQRLVRKELGFNRISDSDRFPNGMHCNLKYREDHVLMGGARLSCFTCPSFTDDPDDPLTCICTLGRAQEELVGLIGAVKETEALDMELLAAVRADALVCDELADALAV